MNPRPIGNFEALSQATLVEMLYEMSEKLLRLKSSVYLSPAQANELDLGQKHIARAVDEWVRGVERDYPPPRRRLPPSTTLPEDPARGLDLVLDMLAIVHDDIDERDFTHMQFQRVMIAAHNLLVVAQDIEKSAH